MINITKHTNYFKCCIEPHFYTLSFRSGWWNRTTDLLVMSQTSYHFSDPHQFLTDYILRLFIYMSQRFFLFFILIHNPQVKGTTNQCTHNNKLAGIIV